MQAEQYKLCNHNVGTNDDWVVWGLLFESFKVTITHDPNESLFKLICVASFADTADIANINTIYL